MKTILRFFSILALALPACAADVPISGLPAISSVTNSTLVPVVDTAGTPATKKATVSQLVTGLPVATGSAAGTMPAADKAKLDAATATNTPSAIVRRDASGNFGANVITAATINGLGSPVNPTDAANKGYVDAAAAGLNIKTPARAATVSSNINLSGGAPNTLDGVSLSVNDRVLVKNQSDGTQNGIYYVSTLGSGSNGTWTRTTDADTGAKLVTGSYVFITGGTANANAAYTMVTSGTITIGTSIITWNLFSQVTQILASNIIGALVSSQIQDAAINTAKFASGLTPVEIAGVLPTTGNFTGRMVFLTTTSKLYRYDGASFISTIPASDLSTQIVAGQIAANAVTVGTIQAGAVRSTELASDSVTAGKIYSRSITADRIVTGAITATEIQTGTITADRMNVNNLAAITANLGTVTAGSITANASLSVGAGTSAVAIDSTGMSVAGGRIDFKGSGANPSIIVKGASPRANTQIVINGATGSVPAYIQAIDNSGVPASVISGDGVVLTGNHDMFVQSGSSIRGPGALQINGDDSNSLNVIAGENGSAGAQEGYLLIRLNGRNVKIPFYGL